MCTPSWPASWNKPLPLTTRPLPLSGGAGEEGGSTWDCRVCRSRGAAAGLNATWPWSARRCRSSAGPSTPCARAWRTPPPSCPARRAAGAHRQGAGVRRARPRNPGLSVPGTGLLPGQRTAHQQAADPAANPAQPSLLLAIAGRLWPDLKHPNCSACSSSSSPCNPPSSSTRYLPSSSRYRHCAMICWQNCATPHAARPWARPSVACSPTSARTQRPCCLR